MPLALNEGKDAVVEALRNLDKSSLRARAHVQSRELPGECRAARRGKRWEIRLADGGHLLWQKRRAHGIMLISPI